MSYADHFMQWARGEALENLIVAILGLIIILAGMIFWKFGSTAGAKAMFIPLLICGLMFSSAAGGSMYRDNLAQIENFKQSYNDDPVEFVIAEESRIKHFDFLFEMTTIMIIVVFVLAVLLHWFAVGALFKAIGMTFALIGMAAIVYDSFSKERADIYYQAIETEIAAQKQRGLS